MAIQPRFGARSRDGAASSPPIVQFRSFAPADEVTLARIYLDARRDAFPWVDPGVFTSSDFARDTAGERIVVAEFDGRAAGFVSVWEADDFIHHLYVAAPHRRRGIGRRLLEAALAASRGGACRLKCQTANAPALAFYQDLGWRTIGDGRDAIGPWVLLESPSPGRQACASPVDAGKLRAAASTDGESGCGGEKAAARDPGSRSTPRPGGP